MTNEEIANKYHATLLTIAEIKSSMLELVTEEAHLAASLVPAEGWPGKNEEARADARKTAEFAHGDLSAIRDDIRQEKKSLFRAEAEAEGLKTHLIAAAIDRNIRPLEF